MDEFSNEEILSVISEYGFIKQDGVDLFFTEKKHNGGYIEKYYMSVFKSIVTIWSDCQKGDERPFTYAIMHSMRFYSLEDFKELLNRSFSLQSIRLKKH